VLRARARQVGCDAEGKLVALEVHLYNNGGCSLDLSGSVMDRALLHCDCVYRYLQPF
jgi:xanthine dehydrogenase/oxidase